PGPKGLPLIGNLHQIDACKPHQTFTDWAKIHGSVYQLRFGFTPVIIASGYNSIHEILVANGSDFSGRPSSFRMSYQQQHTGFAFLDPSPKGHCLRKLTFRHLKTVGDGMVRVERLAAVANRSLLHKLAASDGAAVDPKDYFYQATMSMMLMLIFGKHLEEGDSEFQQLRDIEDSQNLGLSPGGAGELLDIFPWLRHFNNKTFKLLKHAVSIRHAFFQDYLRKMNESSDSYGKGIVDQMIRSIREEDLEEQLDDLDVEVAVFNLQVAGSVSTTLHLYCFCNIMLHNKEIMRRMQHEIDTTIDENEPIRLNDKTRLPYSRACILELFRYASTGPLSIPHKTIRDTTLQGHFVAKDTIVMTNLWQLHHDEDFWEKPWEFNPERFLDDHGELVLPDHPNRKHLLPFSAGPRVCMGEYFAHSRLFLWLTAMLRRFDLE
ncbi:hypothetical protein CAPTEDRAFT_73429, partial [Capitella teleta]